MWGLDTASMTGLERVQEQYRRIFEGLPSAPLSLVADTTDRDAPWLVAH